MGDRPLKKLRLSYVLLFYIYLTNLLFKYQIQNDFNIKADDEAAMKANLISQGILDVVSISTNGDASDSVSPPTALPPATIKVQLAAGQRPHTADITATKSSASRQAPGGTSTLVLG
jgi:hypothetical protein